MTVRLHKEPWLTWCDPRMTGRTHVLAEATKRLKGTLVCHSAEFAKRVHQMHGVKTATINADLRGETGVLFYDHLVVQQLEAKAFRLQQQLEAVTRVAEDMLRTMKARTAELHRALED